METTILHLSDLHFGDSKAILNRADLNKAISSLLVEAGPDAVVVLSGDISFQGKASGYLEANQALEQVLDACRVRRDWIVTCPGNHDIVKEAGATSAFKAFDAWSAGMRQDKSCTFSAAPCRLVTCGLIDFLVINSAYHGDHAFGLVDLNQVDGLLKTLDSKTENGRIRAAVLHHHLIPFSGRADESTTRNAYPLLELLVEHGFSLVLHGHQHALLQIEVGPNAMALSGVGSFRYSTSGFVNSAAIIRINEQRKIRKKQYAVSKDDPRVIRALSDF